MTQRRRVVITGMGTLNPLALNVPDTWDALLAGRSGIELITQFDASEMPSKIAGEVKGFDPAQTIPFKEARRMSRASQFAVVAAHEALTAARLETPLGERAGVVMGTGAGGLEWAFEQAEILRTKGIARVSPFGLTASLANMPTHHVSTHVQALGPISTIIAACASGVQAIGEAAELVRRGAADVALGGGVEGFVHPVSISGFCAMRALSTRNDEPHRASRPFDAERDGFVFSEGCAVFVLESLERALARNAPILAEFLGHSSSSDGFHVAQPDPEGLGAIRAMRWALADAGVTPEQVDYVNAHGTGTPLNDVTETKAIKHVLGEHAYRVAISSTKSMIGHAMGGAGAIETMTCVLSIRDGIIHPTINLEHPDPECDLDYVPGTARRADVQIALCNSFGLGGQNACVVLGRFEE